MLQQHSMLTGATNVGRQISSGYFTYYDAEQAAGYFRDKVKPTAVPVRRQMLQAFERYRGSDDNAEDHQGPTGIGHPERQTEDRVTGKPFVKRVAPNFRAQTERR